LTGPNQLPRDAEKQGLFFLTLKILEVKNRQKYQLTKSQQSLQNSEIVSVCVSLTCSRITYTAPSLSCAGIHSPMLAFFMPD